MTPLPKKRLGSKVKLIIFMLLLNAFPVTIGITMLFFGDIFNGVMGLVGIAAVDGLIYLAYVVAKVTGFIDE